MTKDEALRVLAQHELMAAVLWWTVAEARRRYPGLSDADFHHLSAIMTAMCPQTDVDVYAEAYEVLMQG